VLIDDDTPWVRDFSGRWGRDSRDPFGGESAPTGPKHERDGIDRMRWEDPLGWAGMQKVDPDILQWHMRWSHGIRGTYTDRPQHARLAVSSAAVCLIPIARQFP
jgi:hypothetical protein